MTTAELLVELRRLAMLVEAQTEHIHDLQHQLLATKDRRTGQRLVPAIARVVGDGRPFALAELAALVLDAGTPAAGVVRAVLDDHTDVDGRFRAFGRLLQRLQGVPFSGWRVQRAVGERWRLVAGFSAE